MEYELIPSKFFLEQIDELSDEAAKLIEDKLLLAKINPYRFKRVEGYKLFLFRIRFEDDRKEKRVVYLVDKPKVKTPAIGTVNQYLIATITVSGIDKALVGQVVAKLRDLKKPDAYKSKGIRNFGERVHLKAGKASAGS